MTKVKCSVCSKEKDGFCTVKKVKVHINKKRKCGDYIYDSSKFKPKQKIPFTQISYADQQHNKRMAKQKLKELKELVNVKPGNKTAQNLGLVGVDKNNAALTIPNIKHPLTGDLSRFTTTAIKEKKDT